jgi:hypothetical protein
MEIPYVTSVPISEFSGYNHLKLITMGNLLYVIALILIIAWAIGFIGYSVGGLIHILLVIALIAVILRVIQGRKVF